MTEKQKMDETRFAADCMLEQLDEALAKGEITQEFHDKEVAKIRPFA